MFLRFLHVLLFVRSDVSGGFQTSILDALRMSCQTSNILGLERDSSYRHIDYKEAFRMATLGGSQGRNGIT